MNKLNKKKLFLIVGIVFFQADILLSSIRGDVDVDVISLEIVNPSLKVTVSEDISKNIFVNVRNPDGVCVLVEKKDIFGAKDFFSSSVRFVASGNADNNITKESLFEDGFMVSFSFGNSYSHGSDEKGERVEVFSICRLFFREGRFIQTEIAIPEGNFSNKWKSIIVKNGKVTNTIILDDGIHCKWSEWRK